MALAQVRAIYDGAPSALAPVATQAARLAALGWAMIVVATVVFIAVMAILLIPLWRRRGAPHTDSPPADVNEVGWVVYGGAAVPALILAGIFVLTLVTLRASDPPSDAPHAPRPLEIQVIGHQWWWGVRYPQYDIESADEIHLPVGRVARITLMSNDVIHSFWVPQLAGKTDVIPGRVNTTWLRADTVGVWRGTCAEYCGMQHAHMALSVIAEPGGAFQQWARQSRAAATAPVERTNAGGGADLCHAMRRLSHRERNAGGRALWTRSYTFCVATHNRWRNASNVRGNVAGWIENPDRIKPGTRMPAVPLNGEQLVAVVAYLESLK